MNCCQDHPAAGADARDDRGAGRREGHGGHHPQAGDHVSTFRVQPIGFVSRHPEMHPLRVNGVEITVGALAAELQYHPAEDREQAMHRAATALVVRELLRQRAHALGMIDDEASAGSSWQEPEGAKCVRTPDALREEEARLHRLVDLEVVLPAVDDAAVRRFYDANTRRFHTAPLLSVRHILLACAPGDAAGRADAREQARDLIGALHGGADFASLAARHSACPSGAQGGTLGQLSKGQAVPEFERQVFQCQVGLCEQPVESRYGLHVVMVDQRVEGRALPFEAVCESIREQLGESVWRRGVAQYLARLARDARIEGIDLDGAVSPLLS